LATKASICKGRLFLWKKHMPTVKVGKKIKKFSYDAKGKQKAKAFAKKTGGKFTDASDDAYDKKKSIKEGSKKDKALDKKRGVPEDE
jgi:hypothetical protein